MRRREKTVIGGFGLMAMALVIASGTNATVTYLSIKDIRNQRISTDQIMAAYGLPLCAAGNGTLRWRGPRQKAVPVFMKKRGQHG